MADFDPVQWETIEAAVGPPVAEVVAYVDRLQDAVRDEDPYAAVKTIHDAMSAELGADRTVSGQAEVFLTAYLLEQRDVIALDDPDAENELPSLVARRPGSDRLRELFWRRERTMRWIAMQVGVHWALVDTGSPRTTVRSKSETLRRRRWGRYERSGTRTTLDSHRPPSAPRDSTGPYWPASAFRPRQPSSPSTP